MSRVRMLHFLKDWWKFIQIHQYYTMALVLFNDVPLRTRRMLTAKTLNRSSALLVVYGHKH